LYRSENSLALYDEFVTNLSISSEPIHSAGAKSVFYAAIDELNRRYGGTEDEQHLHLDELEAPNGFFLVARKDTHPVGGVGVREIVAGAQRIGEVKRLWVRPDVRRQGIAEALMADVLEHARLAGFAQLYLETGGAQPEAIAFYPKIGWQSVASFPEGVFSYPEAHRFTMTLN
jgi:GNAT superfamily N-acetyltransferase